MSASPAAAGIVATEETAATDAIRAGLLAQGFDVGSRPIDLRALPFEGTWGSASTVCRIAAGDAVTAELEAEGALDGLSKKEAKALVNQRVGARAQQIAEAVAAEMKASGRFANVEAVNGYINVYYNATSMAARLIGEVLAGGLPYGWAPQGTHSDRVMIEHSQLNTHKAAHVGHLRNICIGVAVTNIAKAAGYDTMPVTYIGDIGKHVIRCLWCYEKFHKGQEPAGLQQRGEWLGTVYAEASARLSYRKDLLVFLNQIVQEDLRFVAAVDKMLKFLWRKNTEGEDIAYLLGRISHQQEIDPAEFREDDVMVKFWPIVGQQLQEEREAGDTDPEMERTSPAKPIVTPTMTPQQRLERWQMLNEHIDWWPFSDVWEDEVTATFQKWDKKDPELVALWQTTRQWSMDNLQRIFAEFGAVFDVWFSESEAEEAGRAVVEHLLEEGIAEISEGLPVVKIDEKLGLNEERYRTLPILRSDGTTLYSTKDLALTRQKFEEYGVDRAIWVVDVRQSLYFDQICKILELDGFTQAEHAEHLGYEFVALPSGTMSSRSGKAPLLEDLRDATVQQALNVSRAKEMDLSDEQKAQAAHDIAIGAIKYTMLARDFNKVIVFNPDEALSFDGHASPYIQYAHARACRILENGQVTDADIRASLDALDLSNPAREELTLLQLISTLPAVVQRAAEEWRPLHITNYVYDLARAFNDFYHACPVLNAGEPDRRNRLALVAATRVALRNGLELLGISAPAQM